MSRRRLKGGTACHLSKWDIEKPNRWFIHVLIWFFYLFLSHFHLRRQRTSFGFMCHNMKEWTTTAPSTDIKLALALALNSLHSLPKTILRTQVKHSVSLILSSTRESLKIKVRGGGRSCVTAREAKEEDIQRCFICQRVGWCKQTHSLCKLLILWSVKSSWRKQEN